jgi:hypothetical protein
LAAGGWLRQFEQSRHRDEICEKVDADSQETHR